MIVECNVEVNEELIRDKAERFAKKTFRKHIEEALKKMLLDELDSWDMRKWLHEQAIKKVDDAFRLHDCRYRIHHVIDKIIKEDISDEQYNYMVCGYNLASFVLSPKKIEDYEEALIAGASSEIADKFRCNSARVEKLAKAIARNMQNTEEGAEE